MAYQLSFELPLRPARGRDAFLVAPSNAFALAQIDNWAKWPLRKLVLTGAAGAGKTHLAHVLATTARARIHDAAALPAVPPQGGVHVVEDVPKIAGTGAEETLFHFHNAVLGHGGHLLMTGIGTPARWPLVLPDLASRIAGAQSVAIDPPDDALLSALLHKLFSDRQLYPPDDLIPYLVTRMERSSAAALRIVADLDATALQTGKKIGVRLARTLLDLDQPELPLDR